jgi:tetratricopeptide (TPR) repeat protein
MFRIFILSLIFIACKQPEKKTGLSEVPLDSFLYRMDRKANIYLDMPTVDSAVFFLDSIEHKVKLLNNNGVTLHFLLHRVKQFAVQGREDSVKALMGEMSNISKAKEITQKDLINFYSIYGELLQNQGLLDSALRISNEAYFLAKTGDTSRLASTCFSLFEIYVALDDLPNMRKYLFEAWKHSDEEPELKSLIGNGLTHYYDRVGQLDSAIYYFKFFENDSSTLLNPEWLAMMYQNLGILLIKNDKIKEGLQYQFKAKHIHDSMGVKSIETYFNLGETYARLNKYNQAIQYMDSALLLAVPQKDFYLARLTWKNKADLYAKASQYAKAYAASDSAYAYYENEVDSSLKELAKELETKYAVKAKDAEIKNLAFENSINQKIKNQQQIIIITLVVIMLLLSAVGILLWRRKKTRIQLHEAQLQQQLLRSQMEPHFIFNSLGVLQSFIRNENKEKSINYLGEFSKLLRQTLNNARESLVPLQNEVETLKNYLHLQSINFAGKFTYTVNLYDSYQDDEILIPPMLMQPFVENAILHGISQVSYKGIIDVQVHKKDSTLHCIIEDNGIGLSTTTGVIRRSLSTQITQERLSIFARQTGRQAKLTILDKQINGNGQGVKVILDVPFLTSP